MTNAFFVELICRASMPDNVTNWRLLNYDAQIIEFLHPKDTFKDAIIDYI